MDIGKTVLRQARHLEPGCFAAVMATGIVSIDVNQHGMIGLARALLLLNVLAFAWLLALSLLRLLRFRPELVADFGDAARGAGFLTFVAGSCVLGSQCLTVIHAPGAARVLFLVGAAAWLVLTYLFLAAVMTQRDKAPFARSINGGWLVTVVATQAVAVLALLLPAAPANPDGRVFAALCLYLTGAGLYLVLITLIFLRLLFLPLRAGQFKPPYWVNMGALAITTLAGSLYVVHAPTHGALADLVPFVKGFTLFFWATATWWIPLLLILEVWRHGYRRVPLRYQTDDWNIVFPIGMYTVGTFELAHALELDFLRTIPAVGVYINLLVWAVMAAGVVRRALRKSGTPRRRAKTQ